MNTIYTSQEVAEVIGEQKKDKEAIRGIVEKMEQTDSNDKGQSWNSPHKHRPDKVRIFTPHPLGKAF